jgi:hypothetical protein
VGAVDENGRDAGVIAAEDDDPPVAAPVDGNAFEGRLAVDQAGADSPLDEFGLHVGAVVDEHDVAGLERRLHAIKRESQTEMVRRPLMTQDGEHFELFLGLGRRPGGDGTEERKLAGIQGLRRVVLGPAADEHALRHVQRPGQGVERPPAGFHLISLNLGDVPLIDPGGRGQACLGEAQLLPPTTNALADGLLGSCFDNGRYRPHSDIMYDYPLPGNNLRADALTGIPTR